MTADKIEEILSATSAGWWEYNFSTNALSVNPGWLTMLGFNGNEKPTTMEGWLAIIHPDDRARVLSFLVDQPHDDSWIEIEMRALAKDGSAPWFTSRLKVIERKDNGQALRMVGVIINIQERKKIIALEQETARNGELIQGLMRISFASTSIYDFLNQRVISSQWLIMKKLGYEETEYHRVSAHFFEEILHPDDHWIIDKQIEKIKRSKKDEIAECIFRIRNKAGVYHWIAMRDSVLRWDLQGEICQLIGSIVDVTAFKNIKKQLDEHVDLLDTLSMKNSHELRAPVATILGLVQVIRYELQTEGNVQELIDILEQTISKMDGVIHEFGKALSK